VVPSYGEVAVGERLKGVERKERICGAEDEGRGFGARTGLSVVLPNGQEAIVPTESSPD
jgi:hypothetical protein